MELNKFPYVKLSPFGNPIFLTKSSSLNRSTESEFSFKVKLKNKIPNKPLQNRYLYFNKVFTQSLPPLLFINYVNRSWCLKIARTYLIFSCKSFKKFGSIFGRFDKAPKFPSEIYWPLKVTIRWICRFQKRAAKK